MSAAVNTAFVSMVHVIAHQVSRVEIVKSTAAPTAAAPMAFVKRPTINMSSINVFVIMAGLAKPVKSPLKCFATMISTMTMVNSPRFNQIF
jgi:hypothetical protein